MSVPAEPPLEVLEQIRKKKELEQQLEEQVLYYGEPTPCSSTTFRRRGRVAALVLKLYLSGRCLELNFASAYFSVCGR